jgi:hypothetical protein
VILKDCFWRRSQKASEIDLDAEEESHEISRKERYVAAHMYLIECRVISTNGSYTGCCEVHTFP